MSVDRKMGSTSYPHLIVTIDLGRDYFEPIKKKPFIIFITFHSLGETFIDFARTNT